MFYAVIFPDIPMGSVYILYWIH